MSLKITLCAVLLPISTLNVVFALRTKIECKTDYGLCNGQHVLAVPNIPDLQECQVVCKNSEKCNWACYDDLDQVCHFFKTCRKILKHNYFSHIRYFNKQCPMLGSNYVMVATGSNERKGVEDVEIIDLTANKRCNDLPQFPVRLEGALAALVNGHPMVCGGAFPGDSQKFSKNCFLLDDNKKWINVSAMTDTRSHSAAFTILSNDSDTLVATGGNGDSGSLQSSEEFHYKQLTWSKSQAFELPWILSGHCALPVNLTTFMIIGGGKSESTKSTVFIHNDGSLPQTGPELIHARSYHACGIIYKNSKPSKIIVAGGWHPEKSTKCSTEILDLNNYTKGWTHGPRMKKWVTNAAMISDVITESVYLFGGKEALGESGKWVSSDKIYRLFGSSDEWIKQKFRLKTPRHSHVALLLPKHLVDC